MMRLFSAFAWIGFFCFSGTTAWAASERYVLSTAQVHYRLPYTMGEHEGESQSVTGSLDWDPAQKKPVRGVFRLPIAKLRSGNDARDCHLEEALGLNYAESDYPSQHVCEADVMPAQGKNAVVYPLIEFELKSIDCTDACTDAQAVGMWKMHGVQRETQFAVQLEKKEGELRIRGETVLSLKDFGVQVKSAQILFLTIGVEDLAKVTFDLGLKRE